jgi:hypothetical protein
VRIPRLTLVRILVPAVAVALLLPSTSAFAGEATDPCDLTRKADETIRSKMERLIVCAADRWEVGGGSQRAICVAEAESDLNPQMTSTNGDYVGLFQHLANA